MAPLNGRDAVEEDRPPTPIPAPENRYDAFLCYAREDGDFAVGQMRASLTASGKSVWVDVEDIVAGAQWRKRVRRGIAACRAFIIVVTDHSLASPQCRGELEEAATLNKLIVPVIRGDVDEDAMPRVISDAEWVYLRDRDDFERGLRRLVEAIETDVEWRDQHARLAARSREWLDAERNRSFLLRGTDLNDAETWLSHQGGHREQATADQAAYIVESRRAATRRQRALTGGVVGALVVALSLAAFALIQRGRAIAQTHVAQSQLVAASAVEAGDSRLSGVLSLGAYRLSPTFEARNAILTATTNHALGVLAGHTAQVTSVAFSPDGKTIASAGGDSTIRLWNRVTQTQIGAPLAGHEEPVNDVAFSPDGKLLASASDDHTVRLWDTATHRQVGAPLTGHFGSVTSVAFSRDGTLLASGGEDQSVRLWNVRTHRQLGTGVPGQEGNVNDVAFSHEGLLLASAGNDGTIRMWDLKAGRQLPSLSSGDEPVNSIAFRPDGKLLVSADDVNVRLWDVARHRPLDDPLEGHTQMVKGVAFSPDGRTVASAQTARRSLRPVWTRRCACGRSRHANSARRCSATPAPWRGWPSARTARRLRRRRSMVPSPCGT